MICNRERILDICREYSTCNKCPYGKGVGMINYPRRVFYRGNEDANVVIIAEGPGITEINKGIPLIGPSGQWLDKMLLDIGIPQDDCFFINSFVCSDNGTKKPTPDVLRACNDRLKRKLEIIDPKLIICLGKYAFEAFQLAHFGGLFGDISRPLNDFVGEHYNALSVKGKIFHWFVEYHPAFILRSGNAIKEKTKKRWENIAKIYQINIKEG